MKKTMVWKFAVIADKKSGTTEYFDTLEQVPSNERAGAVKTRVAQYK
jgi:hypothetical protein